MVAPTSMYILTSMFIVQLIFSTSFPIQSDANITLHLKQYIIRKRFNNRQKGQSINDVTYKGAEVKHFVTMCDERVEKCDVT